MRINSVNAVQNYIEVTLLCYLLLITVLSLLSGFVPATLLSRYNPLDIVKGTFRRKTKTLYLRLLNIVQNGLTIAMLGCAIYLSVQIYRDQYRGFDL